MLGFELTQHECFQKPCLRKQTEPRQTLSVEQKELDETINDTLKNHNWAAIMWAEKKVFLYHRIFASNEMVPGQPPEG